MSFDYDYLQDDIWDSADPRAWQLLHLIMDGHDAIEAERIIAAGEEQQP